MAHSHYSHSNDSNSHGHSHSHAMKNRKVLWLVLILSATYLVAEVIGAMLSGSLALFADAGHMVLDVASIALGLFASWIAQRPPTTNRTYGYYRAEILAALVNGITLVLVSIWICYEAYMRFQNPPEVKGEVLASVALGGLFVNLVSLVLMHRQKGAGLNMQGVWLHLLTDTLGSISAVVAGFLVWKFQWYLADPIISVAISALILFGAWKLLVECVDVLLVSVPKGIDTNRIKTDIEALEEVTELHDLHIWAVSSGVNALSAHVRLKETIDYAAILDKITIILQKEHHIVHVTLQLEPPAFEHRGAHFCTPGQSFECT